MQLDPHCILDKRLFSMWVSSFSERSDHGISKILLTGILKVVKIISEVQENISLSIFHNIVYFIVCYTTVCDTKLFVVIINE